MNGEAGCCLHAQLILGNRENCYGEDLASPLSRSFFGNAAPMVLSWKQTVQVQIAIHVLIDEVGFQSRGGMANSYRNKRSRRS